MPFVEVAVNSGLPHRSSFSYSIPDGMTLTPGDAVLVPFGRRVLQGIVMDVVEVPAFAEPKPVDARLYDLPIVSPERIEVARWVRDTYLAPLFASVALMLPPGFERKPLTFYESLVPAEEIDVVRLPPRQRAVLELLLGRGAVESRVIEKESKEHGVATALTQLLQRGLLRRTYALDRPSVRERLVRYVDLIVSDDQAEAAIESHLAGRKTRFAKAIELLLDADGTLPASELRLRSGLGVRALTPLADAGLIEVRDERVDRDPLAGRTYALRAADPLTEEQLAAYAPIGEALRAARGRTDAATVFLLHGVTGSGKTEVYLHALEETVRMGKRAIALVPEIALTPQTVRRFAERFPGRVAVLHSGLTQGELFDQWHGIRDGKYDVVVGSRSAVFAPISELGLIVIDEEHEWTYKQNEPAPRYHAREAAIELARLTGAVVVLGSATPDVESYQRALLGQYRLLELHQRVRPVFSGPAIVGVQSSIDLPPVEVVDMREELKGGNRSVFSRPLQLALYQVLDKGEQAILFLNRRGSAGFLQCRDCGYVPQCSACAIALSYHKHLDRDGVEFERLLCHQCNRTRRMFERCPMCASPRLRPMGLGVERVEEAVHETFPQARTLRWDRDVTHGRNAHEEILSRFVKGEADVLIGTQMVAKGLDLPAVTLVGVISADIGLHIPDFRSAERTFQLLTQVAGRAGRAIAADGLPPAGSVIVQTYTPDNYAIAAAAEHDYASFFAREIELRREQAYPPFTRLARLVYSHTNPEYGERGATRMANQLRTDAAKRGLPGLEVIGPAPPHVPKWHGRYRWQIVVRSPDPVELLRDVQLPEGSVVDIDPASLA